MVTIRIPIEEVKVGDVVRGNKVAEVKSHPSYPNVIRVELESGERFDTFKGHVIEVEREGVAK